MRPKAMFILNAGSYSQIYGPEEVADIEKMCDVFCAPQTKESVAAHPEMLAETEIIFSGWGAPKLDAAFLAKAPIAAPANTNAPNMNVTTSPTLRLLCAILLL